MSTVKRVPTCCGSFREKIRPSVRDGLGLAAIFNFRLKIKRMLTRGIIDLNSHTISESQEDSLLRMDDLDYQESPSFMTEVFRHLQELLSEAMRDANDIQQITEYLHAISNRDFTFTYRIGRSEDGSVTGTVWKTVVMG